MTERERERVGKWMEEMQTLVCQLATPSPNLPPAVAAYLRCRFTHLPQFYSYPFPFSVLADAVEVGVAVEDAA